MNKRQRLDITNLAQNIQQINSGSCKKFSFTVNGKNYVFKQNFRNNFCFGYSNNFNNRNGDILEVFSSFFLKNIGCDFCLPYLFASFKGENGCISPCFKTKDVVNEFNFINILMNLQNNEKNPKNFLNEDDSVSSFCNSYQRENKNNGQYIISTEQIVDETSKFCKKYGLMFDEHETKQKLDIIAACDFFMSNNDRHWQNILFLEKQINGKKVLTLSPLFDNGQSFGQADFDNFGPERIFSIWQAMGISENGRFDEFKNNNYFKEQKLLACDIYTACKSNPHLKQIVENCKNLDFEKLLNKFEKEYGITLNLMHRQIMLETFEFKKDYYTLATRKLEKRISKTNNNNVQTQTMYK